MMINRHFLMIRIVFLICLTIFSSSLTIAQEDLTAIVKRISPSVVVILAYDKEGKLYGQGSGFFINEKGYIITNGHVLERANRAEVKTADGNIYTVKEVLAEDSKADIILLSVAIPGEVVHPITISTSFPNVGEQVMVIGNPLGLEQTVSEGIVSAVREISAYGKVVQITAPISPGSSGSPVVNMQGHVIGVATFQMAKGQNLNFSIPIDRVAKLIPEKGKTLTEWQDSFVLEIKTNLPHKIPETYSEGLWVSSVPIKLDVFVFPKYFSGLTWKYVERVKKGENASPYYVGKTPLYLKLRRGEYKVIISHPPLEEIDKSYEPEWIDGKEVTISPGLKAHIKEHKNPFIGPSSATVLEGRYFWCIDRTIEIEEELKTMIGLFQRRDKNFSYLIPLLPMGKNFEFTKKDFLTDFSKFGVPGLKGRFPTSDIDKALELLQRGGVLGCEIDNNTDLIIEITGRRDTFSALLQGHN